MSGASISLWRRRARVEPLAVSALVLLALLDCVFTLGVMPRLLRTDGFLGVTWLVIGVASFAGLAGALLGRVQRLLAVTHWMFVHFFYFFAPIAQWRTGGFPWGRLPATSTHVLHLANVAVLCWCAVWTAGYCLGALRPVRRRQPVPRVLVRRLWIYSAVLAVLVVGFVAWRLREVGLTGLLFRGGASAAGASPLRSIAMTGMRGLVLLHLALSIRRATADGWRRSAPLLLLSGVFLLTVCFPTSLPRFVLATFAVGVFLTAIRGRRVPGLYALIMIAGMMVLAPFLSASRYAKNLQGLMAGLREASGLKHLTGVDFDAYSMIAYTIDYVEHQGGSHGAQLLSTLFFFIPRSVWPDKAVGSGYAVAVFERFPAFNVSSPLPAEGMINFGWIGVAAFALVVGVLFSRADWGGLVRMTRGFVVVYPFLVGFSLLFLRGDLMSGLSFGLGLLGPLAVGGWLLTEDARPGYARSSGAGPSLDLEYPGRAGTDGAPALSPPGRQPEPTGATTARQPEQMPTPHASPSGRPRSDS